MKIDLTLKEFENLRNFLMLSVGQERLTYWQLSRFFPLVEKIDKLYVGLVKEGLEKDEKN